MNLAKYRVRPGSKVSLKRWDPDDRSAKSATKEADLARLAELNAKLDSLQDKLYAAQDHKLLIVLQGMDTAGKDGTIRHVFNTVDPLGVRVASFKVPTQEELAHDFLWRVHKQAPGKGEIVIFNRSHYEDILVVRVHKWIDAKEVERRIRQIKEFERLLAETGTVVLKFFLHISKTEQRRRLQERLANPDKQWKFRLGDLEELKHWKQYKNAYEDALSATSTAHAPWYVIPANSKTNRDLLVSEILIDALAGLKMRYPKPEEDLSGVVVE